MARFPAAPPASPCVRPRYGARKCTGRPFCTAAATRSARAAAGAVAATAPCAARSAIDGCGPDHTTSASETSSPNSVSCPDVHVDQRGQPGLVHIPEIEERTVLPEGIDVRGVVHPHLVVAEKEDEPGADVLRKPSAAIAEGGRREQRRSVGHERNYRRGCAGLAMCLARRQPCLHPSCVQNILNRLNHRAGFEQVNLVSGLGHDGMAGIARDLRERRKRSIPLGAGVDPAREDHADGPVSGGLGRTLFAPSTVEIARLLDVPSRCQCAPTLYPKTSGPFAPRPR